jgi:hypothetical protein
LWGVEFVTEDDGAGTSEWHWAINRVLHNWRVLRPKQLREALPGEFSCTRLRLIRANACRETAREAGEVIDCAKWMPAPPTLDDANFQFVRPDAPSKVSTRTGDYVCDQCKHPKVPNKALIERLGLTQDDEDFSERTWRRYVNDGKPMPIAQLRRVVANAFAQGWLGLWQCMSIWQNINELQAVQSGFRALIARVSERKAFVEHGKFEASHEEIMEEFAKQLRLLDHEATRSIDERLKRKDLPPDAREILTEVLTEKLAAKRPST